MSSVKERELAAREDFQNCKRVVVKVGTRVLVRKDGRPDMQRLERLVAGISWLREQGVEVILVSSGAVGAGVEKLGWKVRPKELFKLQMAAAVGQARLINIYDKLFTKNRFTVAQVLLTRDVLKERHKHLNARNCLMNLLEEEIIPIVNENDAVVLEELKQGESSFGDNDQLASLVSILVDADALVVMSTTDGVKEKTPSGRRKRVGYFEKVTEEVLKLVERDVKQGLSKGGMESKLQAVARSSKAGILSAIIDGSKADEALQSLFLGESVGTIIGTSSRVKMDNKKKWIAFFHKAKGSYVVDNGAKKALEEKQGSLLSIGVKKVEGKFKAGDPVDILDLSGNVIAKGLSQFSSEDAELAAGKRSASVKELLGSFSGQEMVHRNNMVVLQRKDGEIAC